MNVATEREWWLSINDASIPNNVTVPIGPLTRSRLEGWLHEIDRLQHANAELTRTAYAARVEQRQTDKELRAAEQEVGWLERHDDDA